MIPKRLFAGASQLLALCLVLALVAGCSLTNNSSSGKAGASAATLTTTAAATATAASNGTSSTSAATPAANSTPTGATAAGAGSLGQAVINVVNTAKAAVVEITNEQTPSTQFNQPIPTGIGSGFIYDDQGHILTNNHVVAGAQALVVTLPDGRSFKGNDVKVVGTDPLTDLAVVQITGDNLPVIKLGDSSKIQVGQWLVAMGYALGLEGQPTVTAGVASAVGRTVQEPAPPNQSGTSGQSNQAGPFLFDVIQTDAAINPGNSGGPLTTLDGEVVGINTLVAGMAEPGVPAQGIGFAIAINTAKKIADQIVSTGHAVHPFVGIAYVPLNPALAAQVGTSVQNGILVGDVVSGSPAEQAGLTKGDIITQVDGNDLKTDSAFAQMVENHKPGDTVTLTVVRNGQPQQVKLTLGTRPTS
ncbi:MAG TPA: trypsin-like peptidase domain-containing protein [Thermomicrobiaceae bacterium]|nr:trypsin-like peptidase domain-containing protein [Thermomicrobiaceae bacterium]